MGLESECRATLKGKTFEARVQLETGELIVGGHPRTMIPLALRSARADGAWLRLDLAGAETAALELGETRAARWAERIRGPRGRLDKLGVKPGHRVAVVGVDDAEFATELAGRGARSEAARARRS